MSGEKDLELIMDDYKFRNQVFESGFPDPGMSNTVKGLMVERYDCEDD